MPIENSADFPPGISVSKTGDLIIWAASEEHEGIYESEVTDPATGQSIKLTTTVRVAPMLPPTVIPLDPEKAGEAEEDMQNVEPPYPTGPDTYAYYVSGFTPNTVDCKTPKWFLVDKERNTTKDISSQGKWASSEISKWFYIIFLYVANALSFLVVRESDSKVVIRYPLASGKYIKYECQPIPTTNASGSLHFDISEFF